MGVLLKQMRYRVYIWKAGCWDTSATSCCCDHTCISLKLPPSKRCLVVETALQITGLTLVQYRDKTLMMVRLQPNQQLQQLCINTGQFSLSARPVDLALAADADGVHLQSSRTSRCRRRQMLGPQRLIGRSTTNPEKCSGRFRKRTISVLAPVMATKVE